MSPCPSTLRLSPLRCLHLLCLLLHVADSTVRRTDPVTPAPPADLATTPANCSTGCDVGVVGGDASVRNSSQGNNTAAAAPVVAPPQTNLDLVDDRISGPIVPSTPPAAGNRSTTASVANQQPVNPDGQLPHTETAAAGSPTLAAHAGSTASTAASTVSTAASTASTVSTAASTAAPEPSPSPTTNSTTPTTTAATTPAPTTTAMPATATTAATATTPTTTTTPPTTTPTMTTPPTTTPTTTTPPTTTPTTTTPTTTPTTTTTRATTTAAAAAPPPAPTTAKPIAPPPSSPPAQPRLSSPASSSPTTTTIAAVSTTTPAGHADPAASGTKVPALEVAGGALTRQLADTASLLAVLLFGLLFFLVTVGVFIRQAYESYRRKDYTQVDYLINGMYTDSGV